MDGNSVLASEILTRQSIEVLVSEFGWLEVTSAVCQRCFRKQISKEEARILLKNLASDLQSGTFHLRSLPDALYSHCRTLIAQWTPEFGTRAGDVLHVTAALEFKADFVLTFDKRQQRLAQAVGLATLP